MDLGNDVVARLLLRVEEMGTEKIGEVGAALKGVGMEARASASGIDASNAAASRAAVSHQAAGSAAATHAAHLRAVGQAAATTAIGIGLAAGAVAVFSAKQASAFDDAMAKVHGFAGASAKDMAYYRQQILATSSQLGSSAKDMAAGLYYVVSAGFKGRDAMAVLTASSKAAAASGSDFKTVADAVTTALNAYHLKGKDAARVTDELSKAVVQGKTTWDELAGSIGRSLAYAPAAHASLASVTAILSTLTNHGYSARLANMALATALRGLIAPTTQMRDASTALGYSWKELYAVHGGNVIATFERLYQAAQKAAPSLAELEKHGHLTHAAALKMAEGLMTSNLRLKEMFGTAPALAMVLSLASDHFKAVNDNLKGAEHAAGTTERAFKIWGETTSAQMKKTKVAIEDVGIALGTVLLPPINSLMQTVTPILARVTAWAQTHQQLTKTLLASGLAIGGIGLAMKGILALGSVFGPLASAAGPLFNILTSLNPLMLAIKITIGLLAIAWIGNWGDIRDRTRDAIQAITQAAQDGMQLLRQAFTDFANSGAVRLVQQTFTDLGSLIAKHQAAFRQFATEIRADWTEVSNSLGRAFAEIGSALRPLTSLFDQTTGSTKKTHDEAQSLAAILSGGLLGALRATAIAAQTLADGIRVMADIIVTAVDLARDVIMTAVTFIKDDFRVLADAGKLLADVLQGHWSRIGADVRRLAADVGKMFTDLAGNVVRLMSDLGANVLRIVDDWIQGVINLFRNLYEILVGHSLIPNLISAIVQWFTNLPGMLAGALGNLLSAVLRAFGSLVTGAMGKLADLGKSMAGFFENEAKAAVTWGKNLIGGLISGIGSMAGAVGSAIGGLFSGLGGIIHGAVGSIGSRPAGGGGGFGLSGVRGTVYSSTAGESSLLGGHAPAADLDYLLPSGAQENVVLPGGRSTVYKLVSSFYEAGVGGIEEFLKSDGGRFALLHLSKIAPPGTYTGGQIVGKTGWPTSPAFGNGIAGPSNAQLCVVYDSSGNPVAVVPQSVVTRGGGGLGGVGITQMLGRTGGTAPFVTNPNQAMSAFMTEGSQTIPALLRALQQLPPELQSKFLPQLQKIAGEWSKDQLAYVTKTAAENTRHQQAIKAIETADEEARRHLLADAGIKDSAAKERFLASETAALSKHAAAFKDGTTTEEKTLDRHGKVIHEEITRHVVALGDHAARITTTLTENGKVISTSSRIETKALADHSAAVKAIAERFGITSQQASKLLDESLKHMSAQEAARILKEDELHEKNTRNLKIVLEGHVNGIHTELTKLEASMAAASTPDKLWDAIGKGIADAVTSGIKAMAFISIFGKDQTTKTPITTKEIVQTPGGHASLGSTGGVTIESVVTGFTTNVTTVNQQLDRLAAALAKAQNELEAKGAVEAVITARVDLFGGKLGEASKQLDTVASFWSDQIMSQLVRGKKLNEGYLASLNQVKDAQDVLAQVQTGFAMVVDSSRGDLSAMATDVSTFTKTALLQWSEAVKNGAGFQNQYSKDLVAGAQAARDVAKAQAYQNIVIGEMTGDFATLKSGLDALFSQSMDGLNLFTAGIGRTNDGLMVTTGDIGTLSTNALDAAQNLASMSDVLSGFGSVVTGIMNAAQTEVLRNGSVDSGTIAAYGTSSQALNAATADQTKANLTLYRSTGDLIDYYNELGTEITLYQKKLLEDAAKYGDHSAQVQADEATLKSLQDEYTGLGYEIDSLTKGTQLTADQMTMASTAMQAFTNGGVDPAMAAINQLTQLFPILGNTAQQAGDSFQTASSDVGILGTSALSAASSLGTLIGSITTAVTAIAAAILNLKNSTGSPSGSASSSIPGTTIGGAALGKMPTTGLAAQDFGLPAGSASSSSSLPAAPSGYTWSTWNGKPALVSAGASVSGQPSGYIDVGSMTTVPVFGAVPSSSSGTTSTTTLAGPAAPSPTVIPLYPTGSNAALTSVNGTGYTGPTTTIGGTSSTTTVASATGTGTGYRQWNALGSSQTMADQTLTHYGISPLSFWSMDYYGQYDALQKAGILGSSALETSMTAGTYKGPGNPITGGWAVGSGSSQATPVSVQGTVTTTSADDQKIIEGQQEIINNLLEMIKQGNIANAIATSGIDTATEFGPVLDLRSLQA